MKDYKCNLYPLGFLIINFVLDEHRFHQLIENKYPNLIYNMKIKKKDKYEIYKMDQRIVNEFFNYHLNLNNTDFLIQQEHTKQEEERTKQEECKFKIKQLEIFLKMLELSSKIKTI